ncbi:MAG: TIGR02679 family protein [Actinomycetota bacterium]
MAEGAGLVERVGGRHLAPLWDELARRMGASSRPVTSVTLRGLGADERAALADLLGRDRLVAATCRVRVEEVAVALGVDGPDGVARVVAGLRGPIGDRAAARQAERAERDALWHWLERAAADLGAPAWAAAVRAAGVPGGDVAPHRARLEGAVRVVRAIADRGQPAALATMAAAELGDPHALDPGTAMAPLVLGLLAGRLGLAVPKSAEEARTVWSAAGVVTDELSPKVVVLGLRSGAGSPLAAVLGPLADAHEPAAVTLSQLRRWPWLPDGADRGPSEVLVVENPTVVAEAARAGATVGPGWPPMVCSAGWPNVAVLTLLRQLREAGWQALCHADFDPSGVLITRHLVQRVGAVPWRMGEGDYLAGASRSATAFVGSVADTPWDPALATAMRRHRRAVFEEDVFGALARAGRGAG